MEQLSYFAATVEDYVKWLEVNRSHILSRVAYLEETKTSFTVMTPINQGMVAMFSRRIAAPGWHLEPGSELALALYNIQRKDAIQVLKELKVTDPDLTKKLKLVRHSEGQTVEMDSDDDTEGGETVETTRVRSGERFPSWEFAPGIAGVEKVVVLAKSAMHTNQMNQALHSAPLYAMNQRGPHYRVVVTLKDPFKPIREQALAALKKVEMEVVRGRASFGNAVMPGIGSPHYSPPQFYGAQPVERTYPWTPTQYTPEE